MTRPLSHNESRGAWRYQPRPRRSFLPPWPLVLGLLAGLLIGAVALSDTPEPVGFGEQCINDRLRC